MQINYPPIQEKQTKKTSLVKVLLFPKDDSNQEYSIYYASSDVKA